jgi:hypothetical protein
MTIEKFIEDNFDIYQNSSARGDFRTYFTPTTDIGQLCIDYLGQNITPEDYADEEKTIPLYGRTIGIRQVLNNFYGINITNSDVVWAVILSTNKIYYTPPLED